MAARRAGGDLAVAHQVSILSHLERWLLATRAGRHRGALRVSILSHLERWLLALIARSGGGKGVLFQSSATSKDGC